MTEMLNLFIRNDQSQYLYGSGYAYVPTPAVCIMFVVLFGIAFAGHFVQGIYHRTWFVFPTILLGVSLEILGWAARYWSSQDIRNPNGFLTQITSTIIGPTPLLAANFVILGRIIRRLGSKYSVLGPELYTIIFLSCDIIALAAQGFGGAMVSGTNVPPNRLKLGSNIMLGGIVFQLVAIVCYMVVGTLFYRSYLTDRPARNDPKATERGTLDARLTWLIRALAFSTFCLFIRSIYRTIELADGWSGKVMATQWLFNFFDATMVLLATYSLVFFHPGWLLKPSAKETHYGDEEFGIKGKF